jgi:hypothetical protein
MSRQIIQTNGPGRIRAIRRQIFIAVLLTVLLALGIFLVLERTVFAPHAVHTHAMTGFFVVAQVPPLLLI